MSILTVDTRTGEVGHPGARARLTVTALAVTALAVGGGALAIAGAASPWISFFAGLQPITGLDGLNGRVAAGLGGATIAASLLYLATGRPALRWVLGLLGFGILAIAGWSGITLVSTLAQLQADPLLVVQAGPGVPMLAAGGALAFATMFLPAPAAGGTRVSASGRALRRAAAASLAVAGLVHLAVGPEHLAESAVLGAAMIVAGVAQLLLAGLVVRGGPAARAWPLVLAVGLNLALAFGYVVAITVGLPVGEAPHADGMAAAGHGPIGHIEPVAPLGLVTFGLEIAGAALAVGAVRERRAAGRRGA